MSYFRLIDPYLHGSLSPEEQLVFERQLSRNPALANEFRMRFSLVRVLLSNPDYPFLKHMASTTLSRPGAGGDGYHWLWLSCTLTIMAGLFLGFII